MLPSALVAAPYAYWSALPALPWSLLAWPVVSTCRAGASVPASSWMILQLSCVIELMCKVAGTVA
jgi:hypothetical protein